MFPLADSKRGGGEARVERTFMACPVNDCFCSLDHAVFDYICVLAARSAPSG